MHGDDERLADGIDYAWPGCAVATVSPVTTLCETSMKPFCLGLVMVFRLDL